MKLRFLSAVIAVSVFTAGCQTTSPHVVTPSVLQKTNSQEGTPDRSKLTDEEIGELTMTPLSSIDGVGVTPPNSQAEALPKFDNKKVTLSANNLRLADFIQLVYSEQLGLDYALGNAVRTSQSKATLSIQKPISKQQLFLMARDVLANNSVSYEQKNGVYFFAQVNSNTKSGFNLGVGRNISDIPEVTGQILHVTPLYYADWRSMNRIATSLTNAQLSYLPERNAILITGVRQEIAQVLKIINAFDRPSAKGRHIGIVELVYISPEEFREQLEEVLSIEGVKLTDGSQEGVVSVTPMRRMRSALIHSASENVFERVLYWAERFDVPSSSDGRKYYTYFPKNVSAVDMGKSLSKLFSLTGKSQSRVSNDPSAEDKVGGGAGTTNTVDLAMTVDDIQNALIFYATPSKYHETLDLIERLDVMPGQVLIEAAVVEVTLDNAFSRGINWSSTNGFEAQNKQSTFSIGEGLSYAIQGVDFNASISFLESNSDIKIVSRPRMLVRDGRTATMNVGTEVPVITQAVNDLDNTDQVLQTVQYRSTGVTLNVTPTINARGVVSMTLSQTVSEVGSDKIEGITSPPILNRSFNTELLALDGKTVILGGLISQNNSKADTAVPGLSKLPVIGNLFFGSKSEEERRVELVVMITPRIITSEQDINEAIGAFSKEYENLTLQF
ncbi:hypothetical protein V1358_15100 [Pseudoalteromonas sp. YIC-656]|uniref:hypothetical protein n=1 Tax=Pseudoalteromonas pernae TaxID=3118054 RepID=UPI0032426E57